MSRAWANAMMRFGLLVIYVLISCYGLYLMKAAPSPRSWSFFWGLGLYVTGAGIWIIILRIFPLSIAFPVAAGALVIGTTVTGAMFLSENVTLWQLTGAGLIITGIALMTLAK